LRWKCGGGGGGRDDGDKVGRGVAWQQWQGGRMGAVAAGWRMADGRWQMADGRWQAWSGMSVQPWLGTAIRASAISSRVGGDYRGGGGVGWVAAGGQKKGPLVDGGRAFY
jgi:hypothetical protein